MRQVARIIALLWGLGWGLLNLVFGLGEGLAGWGAASLLGHVLAGLIFVAIGFWAWRKHAAVPMLVVGVLLSLRFAPMLLAGLRQGQAVGSFVFFGLLALPPLLSGVLFWLDVEPIASA